MGRRVGGNQRRTQYKYSTSEHLLPLKYSTDTDSRAAGINTHAEYQKVFKYGCQKAKQFANNAMMMMKRYITVRRHTNTKPKNLK